MKTILQALFAGVVLSAGYAGAYAQGQDETHSLKSKVTSVAYHTTPVTQDDNANPIYMQYQLQQRDSRFAPLMHPVDAQFKDATVQLAAEALSTASGVKILVDKNVPADLRLTVEAQQAPLAAVLEAIGVQADLQIAPVRDTDNLLLKPWPSLSMNGRRSYFKSPMAPWSDDWDKPPFEIGFGGGGFGGSGFG